MDPAVVEAVALQQVVRVHTVVVMATMVVVLMIYMPEVAVLVLAKMVLMLHLV
jgi:hypothetical protein